MSTPYIIVFDVDGTLIGDIRPQLVLYEMYTALKKKDIKVANNFLKLNEFRKRLNQGIIRPHVNKFIKKMQQNYDNIEFYIYTASEKSWAQFLIPHLEKCLNVKFKRPLLTRDNCVWHEQDLQKKLNIIYDCVSKKRKSNNFEDKILIIDNNDIVYGPDQKHVLLCNTYDFCKLENMMCYIDEDFYDKYKDIIVDVLSKYIPGLKKSAGFYQFQKRYYVYYLKKLEDAQKKNALHEKDKFFLYLTNLILYKNINSFNHKTIQYLTKKIENAGQRTID
jgi:phage pi2 protein 07